MEAQKCLNLTLPLLPAPKEPTDKQTLDMKNGVSRHWKSGSKGQQSLDVSYEPGEPCHWPSLVLSESLPAGVRRAPEAPSLHCADEAERWWRARQLEVTRQRPSEMLCERQRDRERERESSDYPGIGKALPQVLSRVMIGGLSDVKERTF